MTIDEIIKHYEQVLKELKAYKKQSPDCISRQAVLEGIRNLYPDIPIVDIMSARRKWLDKYAPYFECENVVKQLSSVTPQQRTGRWIDSHIPESTLCECSECGFTCGAYSFNYCPNCGAKMKVEE